MRIDSIPPKELINQYVNVREKVTNPAEKYAPTDKVELTSDAKTFSACLKVAKETMTTRTPEELSHIEDVKNQIEQKTYFVPGYQVAKKILGK